MRQKGFAQIFVVMILLVFVSAGAYYFGTKKENVLPILEPTPSSTSTDSSTPVTSTTEQTTDPTANWKTYKNSQYGYQISIPKTWNIKEEYSPANSQLKAGAKIQMVTLSDTKTSIKIFYEGDWDHGFEPWIVVLNEKTMLGGKSAQLVVFKQNEGDDPSDGWALYNNISGNPNFRIETTYTEEVRQILSTFKFI